MAAKTKNEPAPAAPAKGSPPDKTFRARGVKVSVWANLASDSERVYHKVAIQRIYKEGEEFKTTNSLSRDDLPVARHLLQQAWEWILRMESTKTESENEA